MDNLNGTQATIIKVFDPADHSWTEIMDLPTNYVYRAAVLNNMIYVLGSQNNASGSFSDTFSSLDIGSKTVTPKNVFEDPSIFPTFEPYMFAFQSKIFVYGGDSFLGSLSASNSLFTSYDPATNTWSPVASNSYNSAKVNQTDGFMFPINGTVYLGLGYNNYNNGTSGQIQNTIYTMYLK